MQKPDRHIHRWHAGAWLTLMLMATALIASGQFYNGSQMTFGKSRVQFKEFQWTYYKYDKFDVYFYLGGQELAWYTARYADKHLPEIEDKLDTGLDDKIQFIVYNTLTDLRQSNIGLVQEARYNTGGVTQIIGKKIFLYFDGSHEDFDRQIRSGIAQVIINQLLYGNSIGSQIKNTSLFPFPDWYLNGLVSYVSDEWNTDIENRVRDGILSGRYDKFNQLTGEEATWAGHAFWRYIAEKYGESSISNILYMAKVSRRLESGFLYILGISFNNLVDEALEHYRSQFAVADSLRMQPEKPFLKKVKKNRRYFALRLSPDGRYAAWAENKYGKYRVVLQDMQSGKRRTVLKGGYRLDEKIDYSYPLIAWHPSGKILAMMDERKGEPVMHYWLTDEHNREDVILYQFEKILDFSYAPDGRRMAMSVVIRGQSDVVVYDIGANSFEPVTKDHYDDLWPRFIDSKKIVFSSNRTSDTLRWQRKYKSQEVQKSYDLFLYDPDRDDNLLRRITKTPLANEIRPMLYEPGYISFLSDANGIYNRCIGWLDSAITFIDTTTHYRYFTHTKPVTDYNRSVLDHDIVFETGKIGQVMWKDQKYLIQILEQPPVSAMGQIQLSDTRYREMQKQLIAEAPVDTIPAGLNRRPSGKQKRGFYTLRQSEAVKELLQLDSLQKDLPVDVNNYQFGAGGQKGLFTDLLVPLPGQKSEGDEPPKRLNYNVEYFINQIVTQVDFSYLNQNYQPFSGGNSPIYLNPGFNALLQVGVTDLLEDYRIVGGVRLNLNLSNNEYLFSYADLHKRLDKEIIFHRQVNEYNLDNLALYRIFTHELFYVLKYPFSPVTSLKTTFTYRYERGVFRSTDAFSLEYPKLYSNQGAVREELIYDNTKNLGLNLYDGTRLKVFGEYFQSIDYLDENLVVLGFDIRNYQPLHKMLIWANRLAGSHSFGTNKLIYYMGGVDNWLAPKFLTTTPVDFSQNYAYQTLATNMRGFHQNIRNGNNFALFSSEVRFPLFRYFSKAPIKSDFLHNFQIVGFGDVGTAWTGPHPWSDENFLFTNKIEQPPLNITVKVQKEPVVGGFGFGVRSRLLGYFIRADWAWGVEDGLIQPSVFYLSLSLDF